MKYLLALSFILMAGKGWAKDRAHIIPVGISTGTTIPLCENTPYGEPCQVKVMGGWSYYTANPLNKPKPNPLTTEWGNCIEIHVLTSTATEKTSRWNPQAQSGEWKLNGSNAVNGWGWCYRQIGYRSDGVCVHRDPRKK